MIENSLCPHCGKSFQITDRSAAAEVACPWCGYAIPSSEPALDSIYPSSAVVARSEPLSLDDELPERISPYGVVTPGSPPQGNGFPFMTLFAILCLMGVIAGATFAILRYQGWNLPESAWRTFTPPDISFTVDIPGEPTVQMLNPVPGIPGMGGEIYSSRGEYAGITAWVGWRDLDPAWAARAAMDPEWILIAPVLATAVNVRREELSGQVTMDSPIRLGDYPGREVHMDTPGGKVVERFYVVPTVHRARVYFLGVGGKTITPEDANVQRVFKTFRPG